MTNGFRPDLSILQPPQRTLWDELVDVPKSFVLCGGTAVALYLGHRTSVDFDFFASEQINTDELLSSVPFLDGSKVTQRSPGTLTCLVDRGGPVQVSFFAVPKIHRIAAPAIAENNGLQVAALIDLAGMKAAVVQKRAEAKDYIDIDAILEQGNFDLPMILAAAQLIYGPSFHPENTLKALCFFGDGNLPTLSQEVRERLVLAVKGVDLDNLPALPEGTPPDQELKQ